MGTLTSMAEFVSLADARQAMKGSFVATVIAVGDLKSGTKDNKDWSYKKLTLEDTSAKITLTVWNGDIAKFEYGKTYEFHTPWFTNYEGEAVLSLGKYCQVKLAEIQSKPSSTEPEPEPQPSTEPPAETTFLGTNQKITHDEVWAFAVAEATKVYKLGTASGDPHLKDRMILAQVFYKKNMDYLIHRGEKEK